MVEPYNGVSQFHSKEPGIEKVRGVGEANTHHHVLWLLGEAAPLDELTMVDSGQLVATNGEIT